MIKKIGLLCSVGSAICTILGLFVKDQESHTDSIN